MDCKGFEDFLRNEGITDNGIDYRISKAKSAIKILGIDFDEIVKNDRTMYEALSKLGIKDNKAHAPLQNTLRRYYKYKNGKEFPKMKDIK